MANVQRATMSFGGCGAVIEVVVLGTCQKLAGGRGWKQREGHNFFRLRKGRGHEKWAVKRGRVMQIYACDHAEAHPQKKKEVLYLVKKTNKQTNKKKTRTTEHYGYKL